MEAAAQRSQTSACLGRKSMRVPRAPSNVSALLTAADHLLHRTSVDSQLGTRNCTVNCHDLEDIARKVTAKELSG